MSSEEMSSEAMRVEPVCSEKVTVKNRLGLHGRASSRLVAMMSKFDAQVYLYKPPPDGPAARELDWQVIFDYKAPVKALPGDFLESKFRVAACKSLMSVLLLAVPKGGEIEIVGFGPSAKEAVDAVRWYIEERCGEDE